MQLEDSINKIFYFNIFNQETIGLKYDFKGDRPAILVISSQG